MTDGGNLEELARLIERLRQTARDFATQLGRNEALTRYCLIDPVLRACGWDTSDPAAVRVEDMAGSGRADYALFDSLGGYTMLIEAKALTEKPPPIAATAVIAYAGELLKSGQHAPAVAIATGAVWEVYDYPALKLRGRVNLLEGRPEQRALELAQLLWRPLVTSTSALQAIREATAAPTDTRVRSAGTARIIRLSSLVRQDLSNSTAPTRLVCPDGSEYPLQTWSDVVVATARHLVTKLPERTPPRPVAWGGRAIFADGPLHPHGNPFKAPQRVGDYFVETKTSPAGAALAAARLLKAWGEDPAQYRVEVPW